MAFTVGRANIGLAKELTIQSRVFRKTLTEHDDFMLKAVNQNLGTIYNLFQEDHVRRLLGQNGLSPYLGPPGARAAQEVEAVAQELQMTKAEAIELLKSSLRPHQPPPPQEVNDAPRHD